MARRRGGLLVQRPADARLTFTVGDAFFEAGAGAAVNVPAGVPHPCANPGPAPLAHLGVHATCRFDMVVVE